MAQAIVTLKVMPTSPDVDMAKLTQAVKAQVAIFAGAGETRDSLEPVAFGLKSLKLMFVMDEKQGSTEPLEHAIAKIEGVNSIEVTDVRRAMG